MWKKPTQKLKVWTWKLLRSEQKRTHFNEKSYFFRPRKISFKLAHLHCQLRATFLRPPHLIFPPLCLFFFFCKNFVFFVFFAFELWVILILISFFFGFVKIIQIDIKKKKKKNLFLQNQITFPICLKELYSLGDFICFFLLKNVENEKKKHRWIVFYSFSITQDGRNEK